jgi:hypothetical protein
VVDSLKVLDPERPIREADKRGRTWIVRFVPITDIRHCGWHRSFAPIPDVAKLRITTNIRLLLCATQSEPHLVWVTPNMTLNIFLT